ncbi:hypothetical protein EV138_5860 [Kribbella voronezhensis]|uniref:Uncharacterized protein n=1 Tax=Kribbella voronezhensis TaxID=2512212 RepID=A0A4R7SXI9_9ACTN|nr:hypothetical protein [Kribbella voronezhensis]TDU83396.1 hypothetical protein EV138_5860 [Kribbella voronezhensis]
MRNRLISLPTWALFPVTAVPWTAVLFAVGLIDGGSWREALLPAATVGVIVGLGTAMALKYRWRTEQHALGPIPAEDRRTAMRAARKGPAPADPEVRAAALRLAQRQLQEVRRRYPLLAIAGAVYAAADLIGVFVYSHWYLLIPAVLVVPMAISLARTPKQLRARIALLSEPQEPVLRTE